MQVEIIFFPKFKPSFLVPNRDKSLPEPMLPKMFDATRRQLVKNVKQMPCGIYQSAFVALVSVIIVLNVYHLM